MLSFSPTLPQRGSRVSQRPRQRHDARPDMTSLPIEKTPLLQTDAAPASSRATSSSAIRVLAAVFAVAGVAGVGGHFALTTNSPGAVALGAPNPAVAIDFTRGALTSDVRNAGRLGQLTTTDSPIPQCASTCLRDGIESIDLDSSFCGGMTSEAVTQCVDTTCGASSSATRVAYDAYAADLCPDGVGVDAEVDDSMTQEQQPVDAAEASLGRFQAGVLEIAEDAAPDLTTWQCDFNACGAQHPTDLGGVGQYVDRACQYRGGIGCEGALGGETQCRACYFGTTESMRFPGNLGYPQCPMCLCEEFNKPATDCILCSGFYKYFRIYVTRVRAGLNGVADAVSDNCMQFGEMTMYDSTGAKVLVDVESSTNPNGFNPTHNGIMEGPNAAVDGTLALKFVDKNFVENKYSEMIFAVAGDPVMIRGYEFFTANDAPSRDPIEWTLSGAQSAEGPWMEFSHISDASPPPERDFSYGVFDPCISN